MLIFQTYSNFVLNHAFFYFKEKCMQYVVRVFQQIIKVQYTLLFLLCYKHFFFLFLNSSVVCTVTQHNEIG